MGSEMVMIFVTRRRIQERRHGMGLLAMTLSAMRDFSDNGRLNLFYYIYQHLE